MAHKRGLDPVAALVHQAGMERALARWSTRSHLGLSIQAELAPKPQHDEAPGYYGSSCFPYLDVLAKHVLAACLPSTGVQPLGAYSCSIQPHSSMLGLDVGCPGW